eukprot:GFUD01029658.1.p1 GENE.GFUD01029658.1~~GFUD01029658.1.p1  ORF type:complete len:110 (-),score=31.33 GFUD01029658.1:67-396(-)
MFKQFKVNRISAAHKKRKRKMSNNKSPSNFSSFGATFSLGFRESFDAGKAAVWPTNDNSKGTLKSLVFGSVPKSSPVSMPTQSMFSGQGGTPGTPSEKECRQVFFDCAM